MNGTRHPSLRRLPDPVASPADVDDLIAATAAVVETALERGRLPVTVDGAAELLGRVLRARLDAAAGPASTAAAADTQARLAAAEQALRAVLDRWNNRRSHALEWAIIVLIAVDIVIAAL